MQTLDCQNLEDLVAVEESINAMDREEVMQAILDMRAQKKANDEAGKEDSNLLRAGILLTRRLRAMQERKQPAAKKPTPQKKVLTDITDLFGGA